MNNLKIFYSMAIIGTIACLLLLCSSCRENKSGLSDSDIEMLENSQPEFDKKNQRINYKDCLEKDIKANLSVQLNTQNYNTATLACMFTYYNYGGNIRLCNAMKDDDFVLGIGKIQYMQTVNKNDQISITNKFDDDKYGEWALVNFSTNNFSVDNVFLTPLAMKAYKNGLDENLIFVQFQADYKYMEVIFAGDNDETGVVHFCPHLIMQDDNAMSIDALEGGPGRFWHDIQ